jgi:hypothetical protein
MSTLREKKLAIRNAPRERNVKDAIEEAQQKNVSHVEIYAAGTNEYLAAGRPDLLLSLDSVNNFVNSFAAVLYRKPESEVIRPTKNGRTVLYLTVKNA